MTSLVANKVLLNHMIPSKEKHNNSSSRDRRAFPDMNCLPFTISYHVVIKMDGLLDQLLTETTCLLLFTTFPSVTPLFSFAKFSIHFFQVHYSTLFSCPPYVRCREFTFEPLAVPCLTADIIKTMLENRISFVHCESLWET